MIKDNIELAKTAVKYAIQQIEAALGVNLATPVTFPLAQALDELDKLARNG
jgi:hypothetical protein